MMIEWPDAPNRFDDVPDAPFEPGTGTTGEKAVPFDEDEHRTPFEKSPPRDLPFAVAFIIQVTIQSSSRN